MNTLNEENKILRSVLIRIKNLPTKTTLQEVKLIATLAVEDLPFRDPNTGDEEFYGRARDRKTEDKKGNEGYGN